jgi:hypothetical protein
MQKGQGSKPRIRKKTHTWKIRHEGAPVDSQRHVQHIVDRGAVVSKFLPQRLFGLGLVKMGRRCADKTPLPLWGATTTSGAGRTARDDEASALCAGCRGITQPSSCISNTPAAGSGAGVGQFSHWPHPGGGASSSGTSTMATRSPVVGASAGDADVAATVTIVVVATVAAPCCSPVATVVPRGGDRPPCPPPPVEPSTNAASSARLSPT